MFKSTHHSITTFACLALAGTLAACGNNGNGGNPPPTPPSNAPTITFDVTADPTRPYAGAFPGGTFTNAATATANGKCTTPPTVFTYTSTDTTNAPVHPTTGLVTYTAATEGRTPYTITAATQAETSGDSVCDAASKSYILTVNQADADFTFDSSIRRVGIEGGTTRYLERVRGIPSDTSAGVDIGGTISYSSADPSKATVDATTGVVTGGDNTGEVRITATYSGSKNYKKKTAGYDLEISDKVPKSIIFTNPEVTADYAGVIGRTYTQTADVSVYEVGSKSQCTTRPGITYSSSDVTNAAVHTTPGQVTYKAAGTYIITATTEEETSDGSVCYSISSAYILKVNKATADLTFDSSTDKAGAGGGMTTNLARLVDETGDDSSADMGGTISYYSADTTKATVDASGEVTAVYTGTDVTTVVIYARYTGSRNYNNIIGSATTLPNYTLSIGRDRLAISFDGLAAGDLTHDVTYGGARGVEITSITTDVSGVDANGFCTTEPAIGYSSIDTSTEATTDKITFSDATGAVTYKAAGTYTITASTPVAPGCTAESSSYTLNVAKANATLSFSGGDSISVGPGGETRNLASLDTRPIEDTDAGKSGTISYYSDNTSIATVDINSGQVTAGDSTVDVTIYASFTGDNYNNIGDDTTGSSYTLSISDTVPIISFTERGPVTRIYAGASGGTFTNLATAADNGRCTIPPAPSYSITDKLTERPADLNSASVDASGEVTYKAAGTYIITATTADVTSDSSTCYSTSNSYTLTVSKATATLVFDRTTGKAGAGGGMTTNLASLDNTTTDPTTTAHMGGTISYYSNNPNIAAVDINSGEVTAVYRDTTDVTVAIYATFTSSPNTTDLRNYHDIIGSATTKPNYILNIGRDRVSITFNGLSNDPTSHEVTYGGSDPGVKITNITADATVDVDNGYCAVAPVPDYTSSDNTDASVDAITGDVTYTAAGTYTITASTPVAPGCAEASNQYTLNVAKANATLSFSGGDSIFVGPEEQTQNLASLVTAPIADTPAGESGIIRYYSDNTSIATVDINSGTVTAKENTGDVTIYASFTGDNYNDITGVNRARYTLRIRDVVATIAFAKPSPAAQTYAGASGADFTNDATVTSTDSQCTAVLAGVGVSVRYRSDPTSGASVDAETGVVTYTAASLAETPYTITADVTGTTPDDACGVIAPVTYNLIVNKANLAGSLFADDASVDVSTGRFVQLLAADVTGVGNDERTDILVDGAAISYSTTSTDVSIDASTDRVTSRQLDTTADVTIYARFTGSRNYENTTDSYILKIRNSVPVINFAGISGDATSVIYAGADPVAPAGRYIHAADVTATAPGTGAYCIPPQDLVVTYDITTDGTSADAGAKVDATGETAGRVTYYAATPAGSHYTITASTDVTAGCAAASKSYTLTVDKATPTFTFDSSTLNVAPNEEGSTTENTADSPTITLEGVGGDSTGDGTLDGVSITYYSSDTTNGATVDASGIVTVKTTDATDVVITATYSGSSNYKEVTDDYTLSISNTVPIITFRRDGIGDATSSVIETYKGASSPWGTYRVVADVTAAHGSKCTSLPTPTYSSPDYTSDTTSKIVVEATSGEVTYKAAGVYTIRASTADVTSTGSVCDANSVEYTLTVNKADATLVFDRTTDHAGAGAGILTVKNLAKLGGAAGNDTTADMGGTINYYSSNTTRATVDPTSGEVTVKYTDLIDVTVAIYARYEGSNNYNDITGSATTEPNYTLNIGRVMPTITFNYLSDRENGIHDVTYGGAQGLTYNDVTADATVDANNGYCPIAPAIGYRSNNTDVSVDAITGDVTYTAAGSYTITANTDVTTGCAAAEVTYTLNVAKANPVFTFASTTTSLLPGLTKLYPVNRAGVGSDPSADVSGTISYSSANTAKATVNRDTGLVTAQSNDVTSVVITATYTSSSSNYNDATASYTLNIISNTPTVSFTSLPASDTTSRSYAGVSPGGTFINDATVTLPGGYSQCTSPPAVTYSVVDKVSGSSNPNRIKVDNTSGVVTYKAAGSYRITASTDVTANCAAAADATYDLTVNKADVVDFTFGTPTTTVGIGKTITNLARLTGVGSDPTGNDGEILDGISITYSNNNPSDATVDANTGAVTGKLISGTSAVTITASYAGSDNYNPTSDDYSLEVTLTAADLATVSGSPIKKLTFSWQDVTDAKLYRLREDPDGTSGAAPFAEVGQDATGVELINHIVPLYARIGAQYELQSCFSDDTVDCVTADTTTDTTKTLTKAQLDAAIGYIKASNTDVSDEFGASVSLSADGRTMAVGAPREDSNATGIDGDQLNDNSVDSGAVYVFSRDATTDDWTQDAYIKASNTDGDQYGGDQFGTSLSLSADGTTLAVGAIWEASDATGVGNIKARWDEMNNNKDWASGAVYVFTRDTSDVWSQKAYIKASNTGARDEFGTSLSLSADGNTLAVGATKEASDATGVGNDPSEWSSRDNNNVTDAGAVYVFSRTSNTSTDWTQDAYIKASNTDGGDRFGASLSLSAAGTTLAVGANREGSDATGVGNNQARWVAMDNDDATGAGAVYLFTRATSGDWTQDAYIKASNTGFNDSFGSSVSLDASGTTLAVGAYLEDSDATGVGNNQNQWSLMNNDDVTFAGAVYVFRHISDTSTDWTQDAYIKASNTGSDDYFGKSLSLSADGTALAVGAHKEDSSATGIAGNQRADSNDIYKNGGAAYVFTRATSGDWTQDAYIKASNTGGSDYFGYSLSLDASGDTLAVGANQEKSNATGIGDDKLNDGANKAGAVYLY